MYGIMKIIQWIITHFFLVSMFFYDPLVLYVRQPTDYTFQLIYKITLNIIEARHIE